MQTGQGLLADLIAFMSAARRSDPAQWLGEDLLRMLAESGGGKPFGRVLDDFVRMGRLPDADGPWQSWLVPFWDGDTARQLRSEEHTSELQSLMRISYAVFCSTK